MRAADRERIAAMTLLALAAILIASGLVIWLLVTPWIGYLVGMVGLLLVVAALSLILAARRAERRVMDRIDP